MFKQILSCEIWRSQLRIVQAWLVIVPLALLVNDGRAQQAYYPAEWGNWESKPAEQVGFDPDKLAAAVEFAKQSENSASKDLAEVIAQSFSREPFFSLIGPTKRRGGANGLIIRHGYIAAEWGDTNRVDMTFSVTKSYLSTVAGLAIDQGLIRDVHDPVSLYVRDGTFDSEHNSKITWHHLLNQTSDWSGTLWDRPDWADRPPREGNPEIWKSRELHEPGSHWKYNDVRVNLLAYALTNVFRRPLPQILRQQIMDPIDASPTWRWYGYDNSWVTIDGQQIQSVSGGGHWGGGMFISSRDQARFGLLFLRDGWWRDQQLISEEWIAASRQPTPANKEYGYMWWLNTDRARVAEAPDTVFSAAGFGGNYIYVDQDNDLVIVVRWTPALPGVISRVLEAQLR